MRPSNSDVYCNISTLSMFHSTLNHLFSTLLGRATATEGAMKMPQGGGASSARRFSRKQVIVQEKVVCSPIEVLQCVLPCTPSRVPHVSLHSVAFRWLVSHIRTKGQNPWCHVTYHGGRCVNFQWQCRLTCMSVALLCVSASGRHL